MIESGWKNSRYELRITGDGSPSFRYLGTEHDEAMHHSGGAWSETDYIYGSALRVGFAQGADSVLSVGLGLGYNELLSAKTALQQQVQLHLQSFEKDQFLHQEFLKFIKGEIQEPQLQKVYSLLGRFVAEPLPLKFLADELRRLTDLHRFKISADLKIEDLQRKFNIILYDAFSSKATPELWQEDFLNQFLQKSAAEKCILSTYACTGSLKRSLKKQEFKIYERQGFQGKRSSIIAARGFSLSPDLLPGIS